MASCIKVQCIQLGSDNKLDNDKKMTMLLVYVFTILCLLLSFWSVLLLPIKKVTVR
jgi:hypothetical protein